MDLKSRAAFVYIITDGNAYKIGIADNVKSRLNSLQTGNPNILKVVDKKFSSNAIETEKYLHGLFKGLKSPACNEWFLFSDNNLEIAKKALRQFSQTRSITIETPIEFDKINLHDLIVNVDVEYKTSDLVSLYGDIRSKENKQNIDIINEYDILKRFFSIEARMRQGGINQGVSGKTRSNAERQINVDGWSGKKLEHGLFVKKHIMRIMQEFKTEAKRTMYFLNNKSVNFARNHVLNVEIDFERL